MFSIGKGKKSQYAYDYIYQLISSGVIPYGGKLPNEMELAETLNLSRVTIRRGLDLLKEDGVIKGKRGLGNFVLKNVTDPEQTGIEEKKNPIYRMLVPEINKVACDAQIESANEHDVATLDLNQNQLLKTTRWYQNIHGENLAVCYSIFDLDFLSTNHVSNDDDLLQLFLEESIYQVCPKAHYEILFAHVLEDEFEQTILNPLENQYLLVRELLSDVSGTTVGENKFYLPLTQARVQVNLYKNG